MAEQQPSQALKRIIGRPGFWFILALLALITLLHYGEALEQPTILAKLMAGFGFTRHAFERILYLAPIVWAGFLFGWRGAVITSLVALACMLPRALFISSDHPDAISESIGVSLLGNVLALSFSTLRKEREYRNQLELAQDKLRFFLKQVTRAQEEERKRISRELHDDAIQELVVLSRQIDLLASGDKELANKIEPKLEDLRQHTNSIVRGLRRLSQDLRPAALDRLGLLPALEWLIAQGVEYSGIKTNLDIRGETRRLPEETELLLFRITQEALRNVWRHSQASNAEVIVEFEQDKTRITVSDNGRGFKLPAVIGDLATEGKLGLAGMQERAQLLGGVLTVHSEVGKGSSIIVELPA